MIEALVLADSVGKNVGGHLATAHRPTSTSSGSGTSSGTGTGNAGDPATTTVGTTIQRVPSSRAVTAAPSIITQTQSDVFTGGDAVTFTVVADSPGATT